MDLIQRPRRLRGSENLRKMVRETRMDKSSLIYPLFVKEGTGIEEEIPSMEGQFRYSVDRLPFELERLQNAGVNNIMLLDHLTIFIWELCMVNQETMRKQLLH